MLTQNFKYEFLGFGLNARVLTFNTSETKREPITNMCQKVMTLLSVILSNLAVSVPSQALLHQ